MCICSVILGVNRVFTKLQRLQHNFPENFRYNLKLYESNNFPDSSLHRIFEYDSFSFPFSMKNSITWGVKCEIRTSENRGKFLSSKIVHEWNGHLEIFSLPQAIEILQEICASPNIYFTEKSRWVPLPKEIFIVILPRFMGNALVFLCIDRLLRHSISHSMFGSAILANDYFNLV